MNERVEAKRWDLNQPDQTGRRSLGCRGDIYQLVAGIPPVAFGSETLVCLTVIGILRRL